MAPKISNNLALSVAPNEAVDLPGRRLRSLFLKELRFPNKVLVRVSVFFLNCDISRLLWQVVSIPNFISSKNLLVEFQ
jgi:hypothetical protein